MNSRRKDLVRAVNTNHDTPVDAPRAKSQSEGQMTVVQQNQYLTANTSRKLRRKDHDKPALDKSPRANVDPPRKKRLPQKTTQGLRDSTRAGLSDAATVNSKIDGQDHLLDASDGHARDVKPVDLDNLGNLWRRRRLYISTRVKLDLAIKAFVRSSCHGDKTEAATFFKGRGSQLADTHSDMERLKMFGHILEPLLRHSDTLQEAQDEVTATIEERLKLDPSFPLHGFVERTRGFSLIQAAGIACEGLDLNRYPKVSYLYRRFGLAVFDGHAERKVKDLPLGFSPQRRAHIHIIGDTLRRAKNPIYYSMYVKRKEYEHTKLDVLEETGQLPEKWKKIKKLIADKRALRYMEKKFLLHVWQEWQTISGRQRISQDPSALAEKAMGSLSSESAAVPLSPN